MGEGAGSAGSAGCPHGDDHDDEARFLASYDPTRYEQTAVTVDVVAFVVRDDGPAVLLVQRGGQPYRGSWALPGGFLDPSDATLDDAARRELLEETGVDVGLRAWAGQFAQLGAYGDVGRDPRQRTVSVVFAGVLRDEVAPHGGSDAARAELVAVRELGLEPEPPSPAVPPSGAPAVPGRLPLAFDHARIVGDALACLGPDLGAPEQG